MEQLWLFRRTAASPKGADGGVDAGQPAPAPTAVPKRRNQKGRSPPAMTMEEVASEENLNEAFQEVASNKGAPGPDRQGIDEVREHIGEILPALQRALLEGSYRPGLIRRVWIPKASGGQRGLGILLAIRDVPHRTLRIANFPELRRFAASPHASAVRQALTLAFNALTQSTYDQHVSQD